MSGNISYWQKETTLQVQVLAEAFCSLCTHAPQKGMNPAFTAFCHNHQIS